MSANIIHIGYHKTATNWFQKILYPNVKNYRYLEKRKQVRTAFLADGAFKFNPETAKEILGYDSRQSIIICEEELSGNIHSGGLSGHLSKSVADRLYCTLPDSRIVIFIRNQAEAIASVYKQYIKEGGTHSVDRYLYPDKYLQYTWFKQFKSPLFSFDHFEYYPLIKYYQRLFGADRVDVYLYEEFARDNRGFVNKFVERYGLEVAIDSLPKTKLNQSWGKKGLYLARFLNAFTHQDVVDKHYFVHIPGMREFTKDLLDNLSRFKSLDSDFDTASLLGEENLQFIRDRYRVTNRKLADELGLPLEAHQYSLCSETKLKMERSI